MASDNTISLKLLLLLSAVFMLSPFAIATYLPAVHYMAVDLGVPDALVARTISIYVFGMAFGQLAGGTLSDMFGRESVMVVGLAIFAICSVFLSFVDTESSLVVFRIIQSLGGGIAVVGVPATIRDHASGKDAARLFALIALIMLIAPTIAPAIGTLILSFFTWHWIFYFFTIFALVLMISIIIYMPRSVKKPFENPIQIFSLVLKDKKAFPFLMVQAFTYAATLTFITNSSIIYTRHFNISIKFFAVLFLLNIIGMIIANRLNAFFLQKNEPQTLLMIFLAVQFVGAISTLLVVIFFPTNVVLMVACVVLAIGPAGGIIPNSTSCFLAYFGEHAGVASGILGATQYFVGGLVSLISTFVYPDSMMPVFIIMVSCSSIAVYGVVHSKMQKTV